MCHHALSADGGREGVACLLSLSLGSDLIHRSSPALLQESCHPYWPAQVGTSAVYGRLRVTLLSEENREGYTIRTMEVTEDKGQEAVVRWRHS